MPLIQYRSFNFSRAVLSIIAAANNIIEEYAKLGYADITLRQLYYQFVSRDLIANKQSEYKRLGSIINDARLAGLIDWNALSDQTRNLEAIPHWDSPARYIMPKSYTIDLWKGQPNRVEVWVEKDALAGIVGRAARRNDVPYFSCRGYTSQSAMWGAGVRLMQLMEPGFEPNELSSRRGRDEVCDVHIIHLGDHDPSGIDMSRDIEDRLKMFCEYHDFTPPTIHRIALNMPQIKQYKPPPNPAKITDSRAKDYIAKFGVESWELDALSPTVLDNLIQKKIDSLRDAKMFNKQMEVQDEGRQVLEDVVAAIDDGKFGDAWKLEKDKDDE